MIAALYVYFAGLVLMLIGHGVFGSWQDDELGVLNAILWPILAPFAVLAILIKMSRLVAERAASGMETRQGGDVKQAPLQEASDPTARVNGILAMHGIGDLDSEEAIREIRLIMLGAPA